MKVAIAFGLLLLVACNNRAKSVKTTDSITVHTTESNRADGGPNNGLGDTNAHNRVNDTTTHDTSVKR